MEEIGFIIGRIGLYMAITSWSYNPDRLIPLLIYLVLPKLGCYILSCGRRRKSSRIVLSGHVMLFLGLCYHLYMFYVIESFWTYLCYMLIYNATLFFTYADPIHLELIGAGFFMRILIEVISETQLIALILNEELSFTMLLEYLPIHLVAECTRLVIELQTFTEDSKNSYITTAVLLGKHDSFRQFGMFHLLTMLFCLVDALTMKYHRALPLLLLPIVGLQVYYVRNGKYSNIVWMSICYYILFSSLNIFTIRLAYEISHIESS